MKLDTLVFKTAHGDTFELKPKEARELYATLKELFDPTYITWTNPYPIPEPWSTPAEPNVRYYTTSKVNTSQSSTEPVLDFVPPNCC